ncbi:hypothetical protein ABT236_24355 [Streptomyces sp. NPDC001523]
MSADRRGLVLALPANSARAPAAPGRQRAVAVAELFGATFKRETLPS